MKKLLSSLIYIIKANGLTLKFVSTGAALSEKYLHIAKNRFLDDDDNWNPTMETLTNLLDFIGISFSDFMSVKDGAMEVPPRLAHEKRNIDFRAKAVCRAIREGNFNVAWSLDPFFQNENKDSRLTYVVFLRLAGKLGASPSIFYEFLISKLSDN